MTKKKNAETPMANEGLVGFFGHKLTMTGDPPSKLVENQFRIIRRVDESRYAIQYFSFLDGGPTNVGVVSEQELLGDMTKLYADEALWREAADRSSEQWFKKQRRSA